MQNTESIKRTFIVGDEWLYFKLYAGIKITEAILKNIILPITENLYSKKMIDQWFFIRYRDPELHIRVRFHCSSPKHLNDIIQVIHNAIKIYVEKKLIWKVQIDTYQREIERYGRTSMLLSEEFFWYDSIMVTNVLKHLESDAGEVLRWQFGIKSIDVLLDDFQYGLNEKLDIMKKLRIGYGKEFGVDSSKMLRKQLSNKYRTEQKTIDAILDKNKKQDAEFSILFNLLDQRSTSTKKIIKNILNLQVQGQLTLSLDSLLISYIHMTCNRLFASKQNLNEFVLYDMLTSYYKSKIGRSRYSPTNQQIKKH